MWMKTPIAADSCEIEQLSPKISREIGACHAVRRKWFAPV